MHEYSKQHKQTEDYCKRHELLSPPLGALEEREHDDHGEHAEAEEARAGVQGCAQLRGLPLLVAEHLTRG